jgi:hypothetical protein
MTWIALVGAVGSKESICSSSSSSSISSFVEEDMCLDTYGATSKLWHLNNERPFIILGEAIDLTGEGDLLPFELTVKKSPLCFLKTRFSLKMLGAQGSFS